MHMSAQTPWEAHAVITTYSHKVKLVNQTVFPVVSSSLRDMKGLDNQHTAKPIVLP